MFVFYFFTWESWLQIQNLYIYDDIVSSGKDACMQISFEFQHILEILTLVVFMEVCRSESNSSKNFYFDIWLQCSSYNFSKILKSRQLFGIFKMLEDMYKQIFVIFDFLPSLIIRICLSSVSASGFNRVNHEPCNNNREPLVFIQFKNELFLQLYSFGNKYPYFIFK